jgi:hypothetical protein
MEKVSVIAALEHLIKYESGYDLIKCCLHKGLMEIIIIKESIFMAEILLDSRTI